MAYPDPFRALIIDNVNGAVQATIKELPVNSLPEGDILVSVTYSSLNYKDALAVTNRGKIVHCFPMVSGIDFSGTVAESKSDLFKPGDPVVLTGWGVGKEHWGGFAQLARVKSEWLLPLPRGLTLKRAMQIGTAGLTAMFCVMALEEHGVRPDKGEIVVTGATGGVGCIAVILLARLGYKVVASTGKADAHEFLKSLGAHEVIDRSQLAARSDSRRSGRWHRASRHCLPVHLASGEPGRHFVRVHGNRTATYGVDTAGGRITDGNTGSPDPNSAIGQCARAG
jgi:acrylyl-CoA reductase (NADPH)